MELARYGRELGRGVTGSGPGGRRAGCEPRAPPHLPCGVGALVISLLPLPHLENDDDTSAYFTALL